jgi:hypothetical protein
VVGQKPGGFPNRLEEVVVMLELPELLVDVGFVGVGEGVCEAPVEFETAGTSQYSHFNLSVGCQILDCRDARMPRRTVQSSME